MDLVFVIYQLQPNTPLSPLVREAVVKLLETRSNNDQECMDFLEHQQRFYSNNFF